MYIQVAKQISKHDIKLADKIHMWTNNGDLQHPFYWSEYTTVSPLIKKKYHEALNPENP